MNSYFANRPSIDSPVPLPSDSSSSAPEASHTHHASGLIPHEHPFTVEVKQEDDRIDRIIITCSCGQSLELHCRYDQSG